MGKSAKSSAAETIQIKGECPCCKEKLAKGQFFCLSCMTKSSAVEEWSVPKSRAKSVENSLIFKIIIALVLAAGLIYMFYITQELMSQLKVYNELYNRSTENSVQSEIDKDSSSEVY